MVVSLYAFLGMVIFILWQELRSQRSLLANRQPPLLKLTHATPEGSQTFQYSIPEILIGREPACDCTLDDSTVSAQHARLSFHHNQWWIEDMGSKNGTFLNQQFVATPLVVTSGDELLFGQVRIIVMLGEEQ
ncbi:MAG: FHA domain-containing protein [Anaerolineales bacterium]|nr:FHA domain-containing protein [Anaerolineales bacterium]